MIINMRLFSLCLSRLCAFTLSFNAKMQKHFLRELAERVEDLSCKNGRKFYLIAASNLNDVRVIRSGESGGYGIDAQWCDDFHHSLHTLLTGERTGYCMDFGGVKDLVKALKEGFVYSWQYPPYQKKHHGSSSKDIPALSNLNRNSFDVSGMEKIILLRRWYDESRVFCAMNFHDADTVFHAHPPNGSWKKILDSLDEIWSGSGFTVRNDGGMS